MSACWKLRVPRSNCSEHGVQSVVVPWAREGSGFTLLFEALVMSLCREMPMVAVAMGWENMVHGCGAWRRTRGEGLGQCLVGQVRRISVDETSAWRGHDYVTNVLMLTATNCS